MASIHRKRLRSGRTVWELTHGKGTNRVRLVAGTTKEAAEGMLALFRRQLADHGAPPADVTVDQAVRAYREYLQLNRRRRTAARYGRVLETFVRCFLHVRHPEILQLRQIKLAHLEDYKGRRSAGEIADVKTPEDERRESELRAELAQRTGRATPQANARYGWLGRHGVKAQVTPRTVNYELVCLF